MDSYKERIARRARLGNSQGGNKALQNLGTRYSRLIRTLRIILPLMALGLIAALFFGGPSQKTILPIERIETPILDNGNSSLAAENELISPNFASRTKSGKAYQITAQRALQELEEPDIILLENPQGTLETSDAPIQIRGTAGSYNQQTQKITLEKDIEISQEGSGTFHLKSLKADLSKGEMRSDDPITAESPYGTLSANGLTLSEEGNKVTFTGPVSITFDQNVMTGQPPQEEEQK